MLSKGSCGAEADTSRALLEEDPPTYPPIGRHRDGGWAGASVLTATCLTLLFDSRKHRGHEEVLGSCGRCPVQVKSQRFWNFQFCHLLLGLLCQGDHMRKRLRFETSSALPGRLQDKQRARRELKRLRLSFASSLTAPSQGATP